jgi:protein XagA
VSRRLLLIAALLGASVPQLHAGAWNQPPGHGQLIFTSSFFQTSDTFDASGSVTPFGDGGTFRQVLLNPYFEIGLSRHYTLVVNGNAPLLKFSNTYGSQSSAGLGDMEVGLKRRLNSNESQWAISAQLTTMFPAYSANRNPAPGNHQEDVEARILIGRGTTWSHRNFFWDTEAAYRYRSGAPADQFRGDATAGINLTQRVMLMGQIF